MLLRSLPLLLLGLAVPLTGQQGAGRVHVFGRLTLDADVPAVGARLVLSARPGFAAEDEPAEGWEDREVTVDEEGRYDLWFDPPAEHLIELWAELEGYASESWRWSRLDPAQPLDLGTLQLVPAGELRGRVLDAEGRPILSHWQVLALPKVSEREYPRGAPRPMLPQARFEALDFDGTFSFAGLPAGPCRLRLYLEAGGWVDGPEVDIAAAELTETDLVWEGPDLARRLHVRLTTRPFHFAYPDLDDVWLRGPDGERLAPTVNPEIPRGLDFDDLDGGPYTLMIEDPLFEPLRLEDLRPGNGATNATLRGSAAVRFLVEREGTRGFLDDYEVRLRIPREVFPPHEDPWRDPETLARPMGRSAVQLLPRTEATTARGAFDGLLAGRWTFVVRSGELAPAVVTVELEPDEIRTVEVRLSPGGRVAGKLVSSLGSIPRGTTVSLFVPGDEDLPPMDRYYPDGHFPDDVRGRGHEVAQTTVGVEGAFDLGAVAPETYRLVARTLDGRSGRHDVTVVEGERQWIELAVERP